MSDVVVHHTVLGTMNATHKRARVIGFKKYRNIGTESTQPYILPVAERCEGSPANSGQQSLLPPIKPMRRGPGRVPFCWRGV